jgi:hypothetical protein
VDDGPGGASAATGILGRGRRGPGATIAPGLATIAPGLATIAPGLATIAPGLATIALLTTHRW